MVTPATRPGSIHYPGAGERAWQGLFLLSDFAVREFGVAEPSDSEPETEVIQNHVTTKHVKIKKHSVLSLRCQRQPGDCSLLPETKDMSLGCGRPKTR